jgi:hypothetical protein
VLPRTRHAAPTTSPPTTVGDGGDGGEPVSGPAYGVTMTDADITSRNNGLDEQSATDSGDDASTERPDPRGAASTHGRETAAGGANSATAPSSEAPDSTAGEPAGGSGAGTSGGGDTETLGGSEGGDALQKNPSEWVSGDDPITPAQKSYLDTLARQAGEELPADMSKAEASQHIDRLKDQLGL